LATTSANTNANRTGAYRSAALGAAVAAVTAAAFFPTVAAAVKTWATSSTYQHCFLVAPVAIWLAARKGLATPPHASFIAAVPLALFCLLWLFGRAATANIIEQFAFVGALIAAVTLVFGLRNASRWAFPLAFLVFIVPFGETAVPPLQELTARAATTLLNAAGVEASLNGDIIATTVGRFAVAEACAGLNFLLASAMIAAVFAHVSFLSRRKQAAFVALALSFAIVANILRAFLVILAATLTNGRYAIGADHFAFGLVFYGLLIAALLAVVMFLA
jgi:exosortase A